MNANIAIKLNNGHAYVFGNVDVPSFALEQIAGTELSDLDWDAIKEITIKPMPLMESIAKSVLGVDRV